MSVHESISQGEILDELCSIDWHFILEKKTVNRLQERVVDKIITIWVL